jgi:hypothetical protein
MALICAHKLIASSGGNPEVINDQYINLDDFRYEGGSLINSGFQIPLVNEKRNMVQGIKPGPPDSTGRS